jgi:uncharacterized protein (TIGR02145 family)
MTPTKFPKVLILFFIAGILYSCKPAEVLLHGDISGIITDSETSQPLQAASAKLITTNDSTRTGNDGSFLFKNLDPGQYEIEASKHGYDSTKQTIDVVPAETKEITFSLNGIPIPHPSVTFLDFSLDSTTLHFSISNLGKGKFSYLITSSQEWITMSPLSGDVTNETTSINVNINRSGLSNNIYKENIKVSSFAGQEPLPDIIIPVYLNGVSDLDGNYYKVVRIGSQIWMAENLNVGSPISDKDPSDNRIIEKYCYNNSKTDCSIYGGLYQWDEMMQYKASDNGLIGTTQGVCPIGWHIPTKNEWATLSDYLGGIQVAGGKLKEAGYTHWLAPNLGATNESGFSALPGGVVSTPDHEFSHLGIAGGWWTANESIEVDIYNDSDYLNTNGYDKKIGFSVRCVKDSGNR